MGKDKKRLMLLLSIVAGGKGKKLIKTLESKEIKFHFQLVGRGTAPTEMMDIFGLGTSDKDIVLSLAPEVNVKSLMADFGENFVSHAEYGGLMMILKMSAAGRLITEVLYHGNLSEHAEEKHNMKNEHNQNLILVAVGSGYADEVIKTARRAGATGGTVIKGRFAEAEALAELIDTEVDGEREILCILAPESTSRDIMTEVNKEYGVGSKANGIVLALPVEKAYKI